MKNKYEIRGDVTAIFLKSKKYGDMETLISTSELELLDSFPNSWFADIGKHSQIIYVRGNFPRVNGKQKKVLLHRLVTNAPEEMQVDHINHNTLDNRKINLRIVTSMGNNQNRIGPRKDNLSSGIKGVSWHKKNKKWAVQISNNNQRIHIGLYDDLAQAEEIAKLAYAKYQSCSPEAATITVDPNLALFDRNKGYSNNKTGFRGVYWDGHRQKWKASVYSRINGKRVALYQKHFSTVEEAAAAAVEARARHGIN